MKNKPTLQDYYLYYLKRNHLLAVLACMSLGLGIIFDNQNTLFIGLVWNMMYIIISLIMAAYDKKRGRNIPKKKITRKITKNSIERRNHPCNLYQKHNLTYSSANLKSSENQQTSLNKVL